MFVLFIILLFAGLSPAQESNIEKYQFISPLPGSKLIMPENNIMINKNIVVLNIFNRPIILAISSFLQT
jgi:hypothetical protein